MSVVVGIGIVIALVIFAMAAAIVIGLASSKGSESSPLTCLLTMNECKYPDKDCKDCEIARSEQSDKLRENQSKVD